MYSCCQPHLLLFSEVVLPLDMVDNSSGLLGRTPGRAGLAPARGSRPPVWRGHALILVVTLLIVDRCADFAFACPVGIPRPRNCRIPSSHAEIELSTVSRGSTVRPSALRCEDRRGCRGSFKGWACPLDRLYAWLELLSS